MKSGNCEEHIPFSARHAIPRGFTDFLGFGSYQSPHPCPTQFIEKTAIMREYDFDTNNFTCSNDGMYIHIWGVDGSDLRCWFHDLIILL